jgi:uncharacterized protein YndB with AHSA1/START domain
MARVPPGQQSSAFEHSILIDAPPEDVLAAFVKPEALAAWWLTTRSVTVPRPLGVYAVEWDPSREVDAILGRLGGVFYGIVMEYKPGRELFVADAWWLPPDGDPVGPMSFQVNCALEGPACRLRVRQSGFEDGARWRRYYRVIERGWHMSMAALKEYLEGFTQSSAR